MTNKKKTGKADERDSEESSFLAELNALTKKEPLQEGGKVSPRMFRLDDKSVFAFLLEETEDSFLVVFPALLKDLSLIAGVTNVVATQLVPTALCRFLKSSIGLVAFPTHVNLLTYLQSSTQWFDDLPGYFTEIRKTQIESLITVLREKLGVDSEVINDPTTLDEIDPPATPDKLLIPQEFWPKQRH